MIKRITSILLSFVMLFTVLSGTATVEAKAKNSVKTSITKVEPKAKGFKVTWSKKNKIKGYQIQYSTSSKFKSANTKTVTKSTTKSVTISKLKGCNKKYYVRVRTYKTSNGKKIYSTWSNSKSVTTLNHKYSKATTKKPKTCSYCKKTVGKPLSVQSVPTQTTQTNTTTPITSTVYTTATGKKYHSSKGCRGLSNAKNIYTSTLSDAQSLGLDPCSICH